MELNMRLRLVLSTLEGVTVSGRDNLERVLGSIQEIERIVNYLERPDPEEKEETPSGSVNSVNADHPDPALNIDTEVTEGV